MASKKKQRARVNAKSKTKAKKGTRKAKAGALKAKSVARKKKPAVARKKKPVTIAKPAAETSSALIIIDEVLEESLLDTSTILRIKDGVARSQRDVDEDALKQFSDPSLVVESQTKNPRREEDDTDETVGHLPDLFAAEARRQKARLGDSPAGAGSRRDSSLFGSLGSGAPKETPDSDADSDATSDDRDED